MICDETLMEGKQFPVEHIILRDSLANKLSVDEMFKFINCAGRVGEQWSIRTFLGPKAIERTTKYFHKP